MLEPANRTLYTEALTPPAGMRLDLAVGTAYSVDLDVLLAVPLHLVLSASETSDEMLRDPVVLYESLQQVASRMRIYVQSTGIHAPSRGHLLFSLLEPVLFEVTAPAGGVFHPKLWALRFVGEDGSMVYRLVVSSRNITADRSWDVALTLEGVAGPGIRHENAPLAELIRQLPKLAGLGPDTAVEQLARELRHVEWELPRGFSSARFRLLGLGQGQWLPKRNESLLVISPFVSTRALRLLAGTSQQPIALVSRAESLAGLQGAAAFDELYCLHEAAETEDSEDTGENTAIGLHAKVYVYKVGKSVYVTLGSANATNAALVDGRNVELLVELRGGTPQLGGPVRLLDSEESGLGHLLMPFDGKDIVPPDPDAIRNSELLDEARAAMASSGLMLQCREEDGVWRLCLTPTTRVALADIEQVQAWPVTLRRDNAVDAMALAAGQEVVMPARAMESLTVSADVIARLFAAVPFPAKILTVFDAA